MQPIDGEFLSTSTHRLQNVGSLVKYFLVFFVLGAAFWAVARGKADHLAIRYQIIHDRQGEIAAGNESGKETRFSPSLFGSQRIQLT